jgi:mRNA-degrading endonuclease YafQ of YafQ-DinJ toxin-antitoxin module
MPPCAIEFVARFGKDAHALPADKRRAVEEVLRRLPEVFGQPHLRGGLGIRRLKRSYFECRVGRDLRIVFKPEGAVLVMTRIGDHEEIRRFLKSV